MTLAVTVHPEADFDLNGSYETDLGDYFTGRAGGLSINRGASNQGTPGIGTLSLNLDNPDGTFTLDYSSSSLYGQLEPHVPIRIRLTHNSIDYTIFTGYVSRYRPQFGQPGENRCAIEAKDLFAHLEGYPSANVSVDSRTTDEAITAVAEAVGLVAVDDLDLETGAETLPYHWSRNANALTALLDIVKSEMGGDIFVNAAGVIRFLARNTRLGVGSPTHTWGYGTNVIPESINPELTDDDLITECSVQATILVEDDPNIVIFALESPIALTANVPLVLEFDFPVPVSALDTTPTATDDYTANSASDGTGTDQTSALTVTVVDLGAGFRVTLLDTSTGYLTKLNLKALPLNPATANPVFKHSLPISGQKMDQGVTLQVPFASDSQRVRDYPVAVCRTYRYPYPLVKLTFAWDSDDTIVAMLSAELWDQVLFDDMGPGGAAFLTNIDDWFYIVGIQHSGMPGDIWRTEVTLAPSYLYSDLEHVVYDDFTRADASGDLGVALSADTWANDGNMDIVSNTARANSDTAQLPDLDLGTGATDQVVETQLAAIGTGDEVGVTFRKADASNYYRAYLDKGSNEVILEKVVATVVTELSSPAYTVGTTGELKAMVQGTRIRVWVNRRLYIDTTDSALSSGTRVGLFARNASGSTTFDNFHGRRI